MKRGRRRVFKSIEDELYTRITDLEEEIKRLWEMMNRGGGLPIPPWEVNYQTGEVTGRVNAGPVEGIYEKSVLVLETIAGTGETIENNESGELHIKLIGDAGGNDSILADNIEITTHDNSTVLGRLMEILAGDSTSVGGDQIHVSGGDSASVFGTSVTAVGGAASSVEGGHFEATSTDNDATAIYAAASGGGQVWAANLDGDVRLGGKLSWFAGDVTLYAVNDGGFKLRATIDGTDYDLAP